jgi:hypothetical protein
MVSIWRDLALPRGRMIINLSLWRHDSKAAGQHREMRRSAGGRLTRALLALGTSECEIQG